MTTLQTLFDDNRDALSLRWVAGAAGAQRTLPDLTTGTLAAPDLVGHLNLIHPHRIHVLGEVEVAYMAQMEMARRAHFASELIAGLPLAMVVAEDGSAPDDLIASMETAGIPVFSTPLGAAQVIDLLRIYLAKALAPHATSHGVFMDVLGMGVLISGDSGLGKSELALELISRGHGLVADDVVEIRRVGAPDTLEGRCPPLLQGLLEVRGLGLLDIKTRLWRDRRAPEDAAEADRPAGPPEYDGKPVRTSAAAGIDTRRARRAGQQGRDPGGRRPQPRGADRSGRTHDRALLRGIDTLADFMARQREAMDKA